MNTNNMTLAEVHELVNDFAAQEFAAQEQDAYSVERQLQEAESALEVKDIEISRLKCALDFVQDDRDAAYKRIENIGELLNRATESNDALDSRVTSLSRELSELQADYGNVGKQNRRIEREKDFYQNLLWEIRQIIQEAETVVRFMNNPDNGMTNVRFDWEKVVSRVESKASAWFNRFDED